MSDGFTSASRPTAKPTTEHEEFIRMLRDMIDETLTARLPTMGTVTGNDGGKVIVQVDDEDDPRKLGFPRKLGTCYNVNDRVLLVPNRAGEFMVAGVISTAQGDDAARVTNNEIVDVSGGKVVENSLDGKSLKSGTVDSNKIANNAIKSDQIASKALQNKHLADDFKIGNGNIAANAIEKGNIKSGAVEGGANGGIANNTITADNIANNIDLDSKLKTGSIDANKLKSGSLSLGNNAVDTGNIKDKAVSAAKIADNIDLGGKLKDKSIPYRKLGDDVLTELKKIFQEKPR